MLNESRDGGDLVPGAITNSAQAGHIHKAERCLGKAFKQDYDNDTSPALGLSPNLLHSIRTRIYSLINSNFVPASAMRSSLFYSLQLLYLLHGEIIALCFWPDGQVNDELECNPNAPETACCARGHTCLSNGVCEWTNSSGIANYGRGSCTDSAWRSTLCPQFCQSGEAVLLAFTLYAYGGLTGQRGH